LALVKNQDGGSNRKEKVIALVILGKYLYLLYIIVRKM
jgi:hypothetical protein